MVNLKRLLFSVGTYYLFEHWDERNKNIYSKCKYPNREEFLKGAGKLLSVDQLMKVYAGESVVVKQEDGTTLFFLNDDIK